MKKNLEFHGELIVENDVSYLNLVFRNWNENYSLKNIKIKVTQHEKEMIVTIPKIRYNYRIFETYLTSFPTLDEIDYQIISYDYERK